MIGRPGGMTSRGQAVIFIYQNRAITKKVFYWDKVFEIRIFTLYNNPAKILLQSQLLYYFGRK
jgi:hypothetical protein